MPFLIATLFALALGPVLYAWARRRPGLAEIADRVVLALVVILVLLEFVPHAWNEGGLPSLAFAVLGLFGPNALERAFSRHQRQAHVAAIALAVFGLTLHTLADGAVVADAAHGWGLPAAVVLHTLPIGAGVWWLLAPDFGHRVASVVLIAMGVGTVIGYLIGLSLEAMLGTRHWGWFEAFVAGVILHALFGRPHLHGASGHTH